MEQVSKQWPVVQKWVLKISLPTMDTKTGEGETRIQNKCEQVVSELVVWFLVKPRFCQMVVFCLFFVFVLFCFLNKVCTCLKSDLLVPEVGSVFLRMKPETWLDLFQTFTHVLPGSQPPNPPTPPPRALLDFRVEPVSVCRCYREWQWDTRDRSLCCVFVCVSTIFFHIENLNT